jgi:hypothetical protein
VEEQESPPALPLLVHLESLGIDIETLVHAAFRWSTAATLPDCCASLVTESRSR